MNHPSKLASKQGTIFKSKALEVFTKTNPWLTLFFYGGVLAGCAYLFTTNGGTWSRGVVFYISGFFFWTLFEYILHRYIFHYVDDAPWAKRFHYIVHGIHHEFPRDQQRLFMPPLPGTIILTLTIAPIFLLMGYNGLIFVSGMINGYLIYAFMHYFIHSIKPPKALEGMWRFHNLHHYKYPDKAYGVSSPLWDYVFGTMPPRSTRKERDVLA